MFSAPARAARIFNSLMAKERRSVAIKELKIRAARAGAENIKAADIQRFYNHEIREQFDKIVVDAPCSGTGTLGRAPDLKWRIDEQSFNQYAKKQLEILEMALPYLKPDGRLFYITCSIDSAENEDVMQAFLRRHTDLIVDDLEGRAAKGVRIWPHRENTDGFFMAVFRKKENV